MILAAPLVIPFSQAVPALAGLTGMLGIAALSEKVNEYIQENPEESMKILSTIIPNVGIGQIFMSKEDKISLEDLEDMTDEEAQDLSKEEKAELMKQAGKRRDRELSIATSEKIGLSGPGKEKQDIEYEIDKRYDEGGVEQKKAPFDYTKFFRKRRADGGAIGIEVLFEEKKPRKNFNQGGYEPLFTEEVETFTAPIGLNTTTVPSRIGKTYTDATNEAFRIGNVANKTGLTNPESIMKVSEMPMAIRTLSGINRMDPSSNVIADKYKKQGLSSDYRHTLGTSAFKDSIIDYLGSNLGIDKQSGILDTIGSLAAKGATVFEEGKDAISSLKQYYKDKERVGTQSPELFNLKLSEILAQPIEDYEANIFAADQIPFGTSPLKKMEMIQAYRKFGMDNYMQQLENQKKAAMQEQIRKAEAEAARKEAEAARKKQITQQLQTAAERGGGYQPTTTAQNVARTSSRVGSGGNVKAYGLKEGGRVGFNVGGITDPQALAIYNSMNAYGFSDQEIADAITAQGYDAGTLGQGPSIPTPVPVAPEPSEGIIGAQLNNDRGSTSMGAPSSLVSDFKTQTQERQNRLTNPNKATEFFNKFTGGGQADIGEMIRTGKVDQRKLAGIPTVGNIIGRALPDKYFDMSLGDQVFTQAMSGYTGPTVFGENLGNQDPFGLNVRSGFGNYAEAVGEDFASLRESLTGRLAEKYGVEFDEETGMFKGKNAALANKMTNMMRTKFNFRKDQLAAKNRLDAQIKAAEAERQKQEAIKQAAFEQARRDRDTAVDSKLDKAIREGKDTSGFDRPSSGAYAEKAGMGVGGGYASDFGYDFKNGGLASMFRNKR